MKRIEVVTFVAFVIFANFKKVESQDGQGGFCDCPMNNVQLSGFDGGSQVIQSQKAVCDINCAVQVTTSDLYSVIQVGFMQPPPNNMNVTVLDGNRVISPNCYGTMCDANATSITIRFAHLGPPSSDYNGYAEISVASIPTPYTTSTTFYPTWPSSSSSTLTSTTLRNVFPLRDYNIVIFALLFFKTFV